MSPLPRMKPILPWWQLGALLVLCATGIYLLLPDDPKLLEKLLRDRNTREARELLESISPADRDRHPARFRLLEVKLARQELAAIPSPNARAAAAEALWRDAIAAWRAGRFEAELFDELTSVIAELPDPAAAWKLVAPHFALAPAEQRRALVSAFTRAALAHTQPAAAAEIFALGYPTEVRDAAQSLELSRLWQLAGRPNAALAALGDNIGPEIDARRISLLRELNRNREALAILQAQLRERTGPVDAATAAEISRAALAAGAPAEATPAYQRYLSGQPDDVAGWRRLRDLFVAAGTPAEAIEAARRAAELSRRTVPDLTELARILEWTGRPHDAFGVWHELAAQDQPGALDRLIELNRGLFRDAELAAVLERTLAANPVSKYRLVLARLNVDLGRYDAAVKLFEQSLREQEDAAVMLELARVQRENFDFSAAEYWLTQAIPLRADAVELRRELAELLMFQRRHAEALKIYAELIEQSQDEAVIGPFTRLAESLGRFDEFARGLQRRVEAVDGPTERDFILLAYAHELAANPKGRRAALESGLERHPQSDDLRLQMAYLHAADRQYARAEQTLARHSRLREDVGAVTLYLDLLRLNNDVAGERHFIRQGLGADLLADEGVVERVARLREALGELPEAARLWRQLYERNPENFVRAGELARVLLAQGHSREARNLLKPFLREPTPAVLKMAAEIAAGLGEHDEAERYQLAYLRAVASPAATDWGALGDIRLARGDRTGAKRAYAEALLRMHADIAGRAATR